MTTDFDALLDQVESLASSGSSTNFYVALGTALVELARNNASEVQPPAFELMLENGDLSEEALTSNCIDCQKATCVRFQINAIAGEPEEEAVGTFAIYGTEDVDAVLAALDADDLTGGEVARWVPIPLSSHNMGNKYDSSLLLISWDGSTSSDLNGWCTVENPPAFLRVIWGGASGGAPNSLDIVGAIRR